ncbi:division plane positioning ATPase MipZ [Qipengyuania sp. MTN3-11]|uniref:division plane positioning ATPase MipZ n=1 Tax=Qipengyuania sp. MTN3-11 TaxID=3056557 RepID=UPI0036F3998A
MAREQAEHPSVVLSDICRWPRPKANIIVFANEKGGVGKSTLAFHIAISLARKGERVLAVDLDRRQLSLARALENRAATARSLAVSLPGPTSLVLAHESWSMLMQEILRIGTECTTIVIDLPGQDTAMARRAIAIADRLVTPVNANFLDLDALARFCPATRRYKGMRSFSAMVTELREERRARQMSDLEWVLVKNRVRRCERLQLERFDEAIRQLPGKLDLRLASGLSEQVSLRDLYMFGLAHRDCADLPGLKGMRISRSADLDELLGEIAPLNGPANGAVKTALRARPAAKSAARYRQSLRHHVGAKEPAATIA